MRVEQDFHRIVPFIERKDLEKDFDFIGLEDVTEEELGMLVQRMPLFDSTIKFGMELAHPRGYGHTRADVQFEEGELGEEAYTTGACHMPLEDATKPILIKYFCASFPNENRDNPEYGQGGKALRSFANKGIPRLLSRGYEIQATNFWIEHHLVRTTRGWERSKGWFGSGIEPVIGKIQLFTQTENETPNEKDLVLLYTKDMKGTSEFEHYKKRIEKIRRTRT